VTAGQILTERRSFVAGQWVEGDEPFPIVNPADESTVTQLGATRLEDVGRAIAEARQSFDEGVWADRPVRERAQTVHSLLDGIESAHEPLVATMVAEAGQPVMFAEMAQYAAGIALSRNTIDLFLALAEEEANPVPVDELVRGRVAASVRRYEPVGVVTAITPYNGAIIMAFQKLIPALMAGNSVILRPSPLTPLSSLVFGSAAEAAGLPPGVLSVVVEQGAGGAELLTTDGRVDMVSFTGSTVVGQRIAAAGAPSMKRMLMELGGKGAAVVFEDADIKAAVGAIGSTWAFHSGQICTAPTRAVVHRSILDQVIDGLSTFAGFLKVGDPTQADTVVGPLISGAQRQRVLDHIETGRQQGEVVVGGGRPGHLDTGYYVEPTLITGTNDITVAREEIFGPVVVVIPFDEEEEGIAIANDSEFGLYDYVFSGDTPRAFRVAKLLRAGHVGINTAQRNMDAPFGGFKMSGIGRDGGDTSLEAYSELQSIIWSS
jgi:aldehyde dehydrogenase (NAD+)